MGSVVNINDVLDGHVGLEVDCVDRLYLNAYVPRLQVSGQVKWFLEEHLGNPIPSPAIIEKIGNRFRRDVKAFAAANQIPMLALKKPDRSRWDDRKLSTGPIVTRRSVCEASSARPGALCKNSAITPRRMVCVTLHLSSSSQNADTLNRSRRTTWPSANIAE